MSMLQALEHSWRNRDLDNPQGLLFNSTIGVVFMGTPHRASTTPIWMNILDMINWITAPPLPGDEGTQTSLVWQENSIQSQVTADFNVLISKGRIVMFSFFETEKTNTPWGNRLITDINTALGHDLERVHFLPGNHLTLCKFQDASEPGYRRVRDALEEIIEYASSNQASLAKEEHKALVNVVHKLGSNSTIIPEILSDTISNDDSLGIGALAEPEQVKEFLHVLDVTWMERKVIEARDLGTCNWILESETFQRWRNDPECKILHMTGPPGCGKTVLSNFTIDQLQKEMESDIYPSINIKPTFVLFFFFELKQRVDLAIHDLLRLLISQLLGLEPSLFQYVPQKVRNRYRRPKHRRWISTSSEDLEDLLNVLLSMLRDPACKTTYCVIDGLDECDAASVPWITRLLDQLYVNRDVKLLLTSGPIEPVSTLKNEVQIFPGLAPQMAGWLGSRGKVEDLKINISLIKSYEHDLQTFVKPRLKRVAVNRGLSQDSQKALETILLQPHRNGFVWAALMLHIVASLQTNRQVKEFAASEPPTLLTIYQTICGMVSKHDDVDVVEHGLSITKILAYLNYAMRPMKMEDLAICLSIQANTPSLEILFDDQPLGLEAHLRLHLGNLLRFENGTVSFINSTFKRYLEESLLPQSSQKFDRLGVNMSLARACLLFLDLCMNRSRKSLSVAELQYDSGTPFLEYASFCWINHLQAAKDRASAANTLLQKLWNSGTAEGKKRIFLNFLENGSETLKQEEPLLYVLVELNLPYNVLKFSEFARMSSDQIRLSHLLSHAKKQASEATWQTLVEDSLPNIRPLSRSLTGTESEVIFGRIVKSMKTLNGTKELESLLLLRSSLVPEEQQILLSDAVKWQKADAVDCLLRSGKVKLDEPSQRYGIIEEAVKVQSFKLVKMFLDFFKPTEFGQCLHFAAQNLSADIVKLLLARGADCNAKEPKEKQTALHVAAKTGQMQIVRILIDWRAEPSAEDGKGRRPIHRAAERGYSDVVQFLIRIVPSFSMSDEEGRTPLFAACERGQLATAQQLIRYGSNTMKANKLGRTPLHAAVVKGVEEIVQILLQNGSDPNAFDKTGRTPLHEAAIHGVDTIAEVLISAGANVNHRDNEDKTPLHHACICNKWRKCPETLISLLLDGGADPLLRDSMGRTPLHYAAESSNAAIVTQLSNLPNTVDVKDKEGNTPLHAAIIGQPESSCKSIVKALVVSGGVLGTKNKAGNTPLDLAREEGKFDWVDEVPEWENERDRVLTQSGRMPLDLTREEGKYDWEKEAPEWENERDRVLMSMALSS
jgi:ankyrin repeat protein